jgi:uncharacterized membrane protein YfcA
MFMGSAPLSLAGVQIASSFSDGAESAMGRVVGGALILGGVGFLAKTFMKPVDGAVAFHLGRRDKVVAVAIGATCGFVVGLTSVGSGTFFGLAMLLLFPLTATRMVGTDVAHAAALLWVAGAGHLLHGNVNLHAMAWLLIGSIPGVLLGSHLSIRVPDRALRVAFAFVLALSGVKLVELPAATTIIEVSVGVGAVALALWSIRLLRPRRVPAESQA